MNVFSKIVILLSLFFIVAISSANQQVTVKSEYQYGTITVLMGGDYSAKTTVSIVKNDKNNFGLGAGVGLGEVIAIKGKFFVADPHGKASVMKNSDGLSYMTAVNFTENKSLSFNISKPTSITSLQDMIMKKVDNNQIMYAIKVTGEFSKVLARSEDLDKTSHTPIIEWMKTHQNKFTLKNVKGTFVMFYLPKYIIGIGVPGFHTHFLSNSQKITGHVLNATVKLATIEIEPIHNLNLKLGNVQKQNGNVSLDGLQKLENIVHEN